MPKLPKPTHHGPTKSDINRIVRVSQVRDRAFRAVDKNTKIIPPATHDRLRQMLVLLYYCLFLSPEPEHEVAIEYFRCSRHLIEGGEVDTLPLTLISLEVFKTKLKNALEDGTILND